MGIIFLTSTGLSNQKVREEFAKAVGVAQDNAVAVVTTASEEKEWDKFCQLAKQQLSEIGFSQIDFVDLETEPNKDFADYDVIYVSGGNTFRLLKFARLANFKKTVEQLLARGGIYIGVSAGSCLLCPTIETSEWKIKARLTPNKDHFSLTDLTGFNFVPFLLCVHYEDKYKDMIEKEKQASKYPARVLTDQQAFVTKDSQTILIGEGEEIKF